MGWGVQDYKKGELEYILDGTLPDRCKLDQQITLKTPNYNHTPGLGDKVHCVCFVVPCSSATDESYISRLCEMRDVVRSRGKSQPLPFWLDALLPASSGSIANNVRL